MSLNVTLQGISGLANYWQDPGAVSTVITWVGRIVNAASDSLYRRMNRPILEVSLDPVLHHSNEKNAFPEEPPRKFKSQALRVKAKRRPIHQCQAKVLINGEADYLLWNPRVADDAKDQVPEEEVILQIWQAVGTKEESWIYLNTRNKAQIELMTWTEPIRVEISFLSEDGVLNKKPYRYRITGNSWDTVNMAPSATQSDNS